VVTVLALAAALLYGTADFLGGVATRRAKALSILPASALSGAVVVLVAALVAGESPTATGIRWGLIAGTVGGVGLIVFYIGLAEGPMSVVAPTSALVSTILPIGIAIADGERADITVYVGALICLVAIVAVSAAGSAADDVPAAGPPGGVMPHQPGMPARWTRRVFPVRAIAFGVASGISFGLFFLFLRNAGKSGPLWPVVASRGAGFALVVVAACAVRARPVIARGGTRLLLATFGSGAIDATANVCYVLATRAGLFGLAVVLTSLYPGMTVLLARFVLGERLRPVQLGGLLLAAAGVLLVTV
jgi:drug/metabolite transporter (DMT)-like permease